MYVFVCVCYGRCCQSGDVVELPTSPAGDVGDLTFMASVVHNYGFYYYNIYY